MSEDAVAALLREGALPTDYAGLLELCQRIYRAGRKVAVYADALELIEVSIPEVRRAYALLRWDADDIWTEWDRAGRPEQHTSSTGGPKGWGRALDEAERVGRHLDTLLWRQSVESRRWVLAPCGEAPSRSGGAMVLVSR
jgi:hypothetical protein